MDTFFPVQAFTADDFVITEFFRKKGTFFYSWRKGERVR